MSRSSTSTITGTYSQDLVAFYRIADFASFVATNVTLNANAPWGLFNIDSVGGKVDLSGVTGTNGAGPFIATMQGLASGDVFTGTDGNDMFVGRGGDDNFDGRGGNDTFFYAAGGGQDIVDGGLEGVGGKDLLDVTGTSADENFFIEIPAEYDARTGPRLCRLVRNPRLLGRRHPRRGERDRGHRHPWRRRRRHAHRVRQLHRHLAADLDHHGR